MTTSTLDRKVRSTRTSSETEPGRRRRRRTPGTTNMQKVALYALLVVAAFLALFPIFLVLSGSLQTVSEVYGGTKLVPAVPQWANYVQAWNEGHLGVYLTNSVIYTGSAIIGILIVSSMAGYALARIDFRGKELFSFIILAVLIIPAPAMFIAQYKLLITLGLTNNRIGYIAILITSGIPMATLIMRGFFANQPKDLEEAAALDGASSFRIFRSVILPLAKPGLVAVAVIQGLAAWNEYLMALVLFNDDSLMPIQRGLTSFQAADTPQQQILLAATAISVLPVIIFYLFAQRQIIQGIGAGALK